MVNLFTGSVKNLEKEMSKVVYVFELSTNLVAAIKTIFLVLVVVLPPPDT